MMLLSLLILVVASGYSPDSWTPPIWDESCSFTRDDVYRGLKLYVDVDPRDEQITKHEIELALDKYIPWYVPKFALVGRIDDIIQNCDYDKNGVITARDFLLSKDTCLPFKRNWCTVQWFYDNIQNGNLGKK